MKRKPVTLWVVWFSVLILSCVSQVSAQMPELSLGTIVDYHTSVIAPGVKSSWAHVDSSLGPQQLFCLTVDREEESITFQTGLSEGQVLGLEPTTVQAQRVSHRGHMVIGAVNGDFYDVTNGVPSGIMIHQGRLLTSPHPSGAAFGVDTFGKGVIGTPEFRTEIKVNGVTQEVEDILLNKTLDPSALVVFTPDYADFTYTADNTLEVIVSQEEVDFTGGYSAAGTVQETNDKGSSPLTPGTFVLSATGEMEEFLSLLTQGDRIEIRFELMSPWDSVVEAVSGRHLLIKDGVNQYSSPTAGAEAPRTAVGIKEDGTFIFVVVDGRNPGYSEGISIPQLAWLMEELGAVDAVNLDGGGSSTMLARLPGDHGLTILNRPSDGNERSVANSFLIISKGYSGELRSLSVIPNRLRILSGSSYQFTAGGLDEYNNPVPLSESVQWKVVGECGVITQTGLFTAGSAAEGYVKAVLPNGVRGTVPVEVVPQLTEIRVAQTHLAVDPDSTTPIDISPLYQGQSVAASPADFDWEIIGPIGEVKDGVFFASSAPSSGIIRISHGDIAAEVMVDVGRKPVLLEDFSQGIDHWIVSGVGFRGIRASLGVSPEDLVRIGEHALRIDYDFQGQTGVSGVYAQPITSYVLEGYPEKIGMWVYGDGEGLWLRGQLLDGDNNAFSIDFTSDYPNGVTWEGWRYVEALIPKGKATPLRLQIPLRLMSTSEHKGSGTIYLDYIQAFYGDNVGDVTTPQITRLAPLPDSVVESNTPTIKAMIWDGDSGIDPLTIQMRVNGEYVDIHFENDIVSYTPRRPLIDGLHEVYLEARDYAGNPSSRRWTFTVETGAPKIEIRGPENIYDQSSLSLEVVALNLENLTELTVTLELTDGISIKSVDTGAFGGDVVYDGNRVRLAMRDLNFSHLSEESVVIAWITVEVPEGLKKVTAELVEGSIGLPWTQALKIKMEPFVRKVWPRLVLTVDGLEVGLPSTIRLFDQFLNEPVADARVEVLDSDNQLATTLEEAHVYRRPNAASPVEFVTQVGQQFLTGREVREFTELLLPDGNSGWVESRSIRTESWGTPLGYTDQSGSLVTDSLTLAAVNVKLQGIVDGIYSPASLLEIKIPLLGDQPENIVLTWSADPQTTQTISWWTHPRVKDSIVEYWVDPETKKAEGASFVLPTSLGDVRIHRVTLCDLQSNQLYNYRVGDGSVDGWSDVSVFRTGVSDEEFSFIFATDTQTGGAFHIWERLLTEALERNPDARFLVHGGDIVDNGFNFEEWKNFVSHSQDFLTRLPLVATLGNHDVYGDGRLFFSSLFPYPLHGPVGEEGYVFSFDYGAAHFVILNSEADQKALQEQADWLRADVTHSDKPWNIVIFHRAPYKSNPLRGEDKTLSVLAPVIEELGIDLALVGHDHVYMRTHPMRNGEVSDQGTVYVIGGSAGPKFYPGEWSPYTAKLFDDDVQVYTVLNVNADTIRACVYTIEGELVDTFVLK